jgi:hypothetical protein
LEKSGMLFDDAKTQASNERELRMFGDGEERLCKETLQSRSLEDIEISIGSWKGEEGDAGDE